MESDAARELIHYANQYGLMLEIELKLKRNEQVQRNLKNIREDLSVLSVSTRNLEKWLGSDHPLMKDIHSLNTALKARLEHLTSSRVSKSMIVLTSVKFFIKLAAKYGSNVY